MNVDGIPYRSIWFDDENHSVNVIDQTLLPHFFETITLNSLQEACLAITSMQVRGAPLIGATAAFGMYLALREDHVDLNEAARRLVDTRPTAVNLQWAVQRVKSAIDHKQSREVQVSSALDVAKTICEEDVANCKAIGSHGVELIRQLSLQHQRTIHVLTHCNAGWLATVDRGTALAPVYEAWEEGIDIHVWVDETRPRNQGASLTAWELLHQDIPHTVISDNTGGHLMQQGQVDLCLVGSDRTSYKGNVCNKIGTYLKALAAYDNNVLFYAAVPLSSVDWDADEFPIEERDGGEISVIRGLNTQGELDSVRLLPKDSPVLNVAFDVTPARLVSGIITEKGIFEASLEGMEQLRSKILE